MEYKFIDLFAGLGGLRVGLEQALEEMGHTSRCVMTSEIKAHAKEVYKQNFVGEEIRGDIREIQSVDIPNFDILLGGFPCQSFSTAGKQRGFEDTRGTLFFEVARILREKKPRAFILENVEGLVKHDMSAEGKKEKRATGTTLDIILKTLQDLGYTVTWRVIQASDMGVAQIRRRIYIVGHKDREVSLEGFEKKVVTFGEVQERGKETKETDFTRALFKYLEDRGLSEDYLYDKAIRDKRGTASNIHSWTLGLRGDVTEEQHSFLESLVQKRRKREYAANKGYGVKDGLGLTKEEIKEFSEITEEGLEGLLEKGYIKRENLDAKYEIYDIKSGRLSFEYAKILDPKKPCLTLVATEVTRIGVLDGNGIRKLTLREGLRLNGFPEGYKMEIDYKKGMDLIGNTVVVPIIKEIAKRIIDK